MPISRDTYATGLTAEQFLDVIQANKEKFLENIEKASFSSEDLQFFRDNPVSIAAIGEDWCTDVVHFLPVAIKLSREVPEIDLRIFLRDSTDLIDNYLYQGEFKSIPVMILYDKGWNELGHFTERPAAARQAMAEESARFARENAQLEGVNRTYDKMPDETRNAVRANSANFRWSNFDAWNKLFVDELKSIVQGGVAVGD
jgi:hypothetical protein